MVNSAVPNWKPQSIGGDQNDAFAVTNHLIAAPRAIVEIDANLAAIEDFEASGPGRAVVGVGVAVGTVRLVAGFGAVVEFQHLPVQQIAHLRGVENLIGVTKTVLGKDRGGDCRAAAVSLYGL